MACHLRSTTGYPETPATGSLPSPAAYMETLAAHSSPDTRSRLPTGCSSGSKYSASAFTWSSRVPDAALKRTMCSRQLYWRQQTAHPSSPATTSVFCRQTISMRMKHASVFRKGEALVTPIDPGATANTSTSKAAAICQACLRIFPKRYRIRWKSPSAAAWNSSLARHFCRRFRCRKDKPPRRSSSPSQNPACNNSWTKKSRKILFPATRKMSLPHLTDLA